MPADKCGQCQAPFEVAGADRNSAARNVRRLQNIGGSHAASKLEYLQGREQIAESRGAGAWGAEEIRLAWLHIDLDCL